MKRAITWMLINFSMAACLALAVFKHYGWAQNLVLFAIWFNFAVVVLTNFPGKAIEKAREKIRQKGRPVPIWLDVGYDMATLVFLVAFGWIASAIAYLIASIGQNAIYSGKENERHSST